MITLFVGIGKRRALKLGMKWESKEVFVSNTQRMSGLNRKKFKLSTLNNPISTCTSMNVSFILFMSCLFHDKRAQIQCILLPHIYGMSLTVPIKD